MIYLIDFCSLPWWLPWLLSGLLGLLAGLLLGNMIWGKWKKMFSDMEDKYKSLQSKYGDLEGDLKTCNHDKAILEGDIATANGRVKEMKVKLDEALSSNEGAVEGAVGGAVAGGMAFAGDASEKDTTESTGSDSVTGATSSAYASLKNDNLQIIEGIGPKMESVLKEAGVNTWSDLAFKKPEELRALLDSHGDKYKIINPEFWPQQAALASNGKFDELITLQKQLDTGNDTNINLTDSKLEKLLSKSNKAGFGKFKNNDLKIVEGIGPKISELLNNNGIKSWKELSETSVEKIQEILDSQGSKFKLANPGSWPKQAGLAAAGKWTELAKLQDELQGGV